MPKEFVKFSENTANAANLIFFPHAGSSAGAYKGIADRFAAKVDCHVQSRSGNSESISSLVDRAHQYILENAINRPVLFGHSFGGIVAWELATRLTGSGDQNLAGLILSGIRFPSRDRLSKLQKSDLGESFLGGDIELDQNTKEYFANRVKQEIETLAEYEMAPDSAVECPVLSLHFEEDTLVNLDDVLNWRQRCRGSFENVVHQGGHFRVLEKDFDTVFIDKFISLVL